MTPDAAPTALPTLLSATLYLMSAFADNGCPLVAAMVRKHLDILRAHPDSDPLLRSTCVRLAERHWAQTGAAQRTLAERHGAVLH
jgi:hypothetical protein